jgi:multiple sugar transport system ATP-binding protein
MAEIRFEHVVKRFDDTAAVDDFDLRVADHELMVFVGPSGCGKTTALRMVAGLEQVSDGRILIDGQDVTNVEPRDRDVAMIFQNYALYPHLTVRQNMAFGLRLRHAPKREIDERVTSTARTLQLEELLDRRPRQLSGGQRQRVAMGRAIVRDPKAFLMDEPLSNLDAKLRVQMRAVIARLQRRLDVTTIYVTHDQIEAMTLGHRVAVMRQGRLQQVAPPQELYRRPVNLFVASFIGSPAMNVAEATLEREGEALVAGFGENRVRVDPRLVAERPALEGYAGRKVILGVRPQNIEDAALVAGVAEDETFEAPVELREDLGAEVDVHLRVDAPVPALEMVIEAAEAGAETGAGPEGRPGGLFVARLGAATTATEGRPLRLWIDPRALYFFDPESGAAIHD